MKKLFLLMLIIVVAMGLAGCGEEPAVEEEATAVPEVETSSDAAEEAVEEAEEEAAVEEAAAEAGASATFRPSTATSFPARCENDANAGSSLLHGWHQEAQKFTRITFPS